MKAEIETKAKITNITNVLFWLSLNAKFINNSFQEDILYDFTPKSFILDKKTLKADEFLRIRHTDKSDILTHKLIKRDNDGNFLYCDENETIISPTHINEINSILKIFNLKNLSKNDCKNALMLGLFLQKNNFIELIRIKKKRKEYTLNEFNIAVDEIDSLGYFIEIEIIKDNASKEEILLLQNNELDLLRKIKISTRNIVKKGYLDLLMEKKNERNF